MSEEEIPSSVRDFIAQFITSVAQLEILLLLKTNPSQSWTPTTIARELRIDAKAAAEQLEVLARDGLLAPGPPPDDAYRYGPKTAALDQAVTGLAQAYLVRRVTITGLIFSKSTRVIRAFSDAFRLRREDPHG